MSKIYVSTYAKYAAGNLTGAWIDPKDYDNLSEFEAACEELHADEHDPEFMFQDSEGIPKFFVSESSVSEDLWDYLACDQDEDVKHAYVYLFDQWDSNDLEERYRGEYNSWEEMAELLVDELGYLDEMPENLRYYFDYEKYARDLRLSGDLYEHAGHFFWSA